MIIYDLKGEDVLGVDRTAGAIRGRIDRVLDVVIAEMDKYESGEYTQTVLESVRVLRDQSKENFIIFKLVVEFSSTKFY